MKALIIKKHWLDKIFDDGKIWEMRSTKTKIRGEILLIESRSGLIMGKAYLAECHQPIDEYKENIFYEYHRINDMELLKKWKYPWAIRDAERFDKPRPYIHPQGAVVWVNIEDELLCK